jgi:hypothetical protein
MCEVLRIKFIKWLMKYHRFLNATVRKSPLGSELMEVSILHGIICFHSNMSLILVLIFMKIS